MFITAIIAAYFAIGCVFGVAFCLRGYAVIAPEARGASFGLRVLWTPAAVVLWPLLLRKWRRATK